MEALSALEKKRRIKAMRKYLRIEDNGIFKALVGEDYLTVEKKNKNPFSFQPYARLLFSCNTQVRHMTL
jgi:phage/plasmid-associated DNA primase